MIEDYIDDLFCCGYGDQIKDCCACCCILCEICEEDDNKEETGGDIEMPRRIEPPLADTVPTAMAVEPKNLKIDTNTLYRVDEGVTTPGGTTIRRRRYEI